MSGNHLGRVRVSFTGDEDLAYGRRCRSIHISHSHLMGGGTDEQITEGIISQYAVFIHSWLLHYVGIAIEFLFIETEVESGSIRTDRKAFPFSLSFETTLYLECGIDLVFPPQHETQSRAHRVAIDRSINCRLILGAFYLHHTRSDRQSAQRVALSRLKDILIMQSLLDVAIDISQSDGLSHVGAPFCHHFSERILRLLIFVYFQHCAHLSVAFTCLVRLNASLSINHSYSHECQRVAFWVSSTQLFERKRTNTFCYEVVVEHATLIGVDTIEIIAYVVEVIPSDVVFRRPSQHDAITIASRKHIDGSRAYPHFLLDDRVGLLHRLIAILRKSHVSRCRGRSARCKYCRCRHRYEERC